MGTENIEANGIERKTMDYLAERASVIILVTDSNPDKPHWAFARMTPEQYIQYKAAEAKGAFNLLDFTSEVLASGQGLTPPKEVMQQMQQEQGFDVDFINHLNEMIGESLVNPARTSGRIAG